MIACIRIILLPYTCSVLLYYQAKSQHLHIAGEYPKLMKYQIKRYNFQLRIVNSTKLELFPNAILKDQLV